jgi:serine/threonine protein phosphatase PrpC
MRNHSPEMLVIPPQEPTPNSGSRLKRAHRPSEEAPEVAAEDFLSLVEPEAIPEADVKLEEEEEVELSPEEIEIVRNPGELQEASVVPALEVHGFKGLEVAATLEKEDERKNLPEGDPKKRNQDNIIADPETGLIGVLDGLGGEGGGDLASKSAEQAIPEAYRRAMKRNDKLPIADVQHELVERQLAKIGASKPEIAIEHRKQLTNMTEDIIARDPAMARRALSLLESFNDANKSVTETGGKTTACIGFVHEAKDGSRWVVAASVGDSVAYKRRANGEIVQLTKEDSLLNQLQDAGFITPELLANMKAEPKKTHLVPISVEIAQALGASGEVAKRLAASGVPLTYHKLKVSMVASLGSELSRPSLTVRRLDAGDEAFFATDGLVDKFEDQTTEETDLGALSTEASRGKKLTERMDHLRAEAKRRKTVAKDDDDVAIVAIHVKK